MAIQIVEIIGPSDQGRSRPYRCRAEDGEIYFVKGRQTNRSSLWNEWICAHLAQAFGLAVPPFGILDVSPELLAETPLGWREIGEGPAFGSMLHASAAWLEPSMAANVPIASQRDVLVFDWWVRNCDRQIGNTNLLWDAGAKKLVVIDHNLAFDPDFSAADFIEQHIFAPQWAQISADLVLQAEYSTRLSAALELAAPACENAPPEWGWMNPEMDLRANFDLENIFATLARCASPELWRTV
ncbi:HipA family kinase [Paucibacter sp. AS339]|uniref:HipA-like kinase domain-containing protein n=1 Tax=Roseateles koreensis TaxID=2987526 RepID=A0ABT5KY08_9BURK|nr:HipA family kinase [Roseateles koreensis]MDC8787265.1 hypothetical protein [Roseateles koreensis]